MANNRFERIISGTLQEQTNVFDANVVIEDIDVNGSNYGFTLEWNETGLLSAGRSEQDFFVSGNANGPVRSQSGIDRSTTQATTDQDQTVVWTVRELSESGNTVNFEVVQQLGYRADSTSDVFIYNGISFTETLDGSSRNEKVFLEGGNDTYYSSDGRSAFNGGVDEVYGGSGNDRAYMYNRDTTNTENYAGTFDGGSGTDTLYLNGSYTDYGIYQHGNTLVYRYTSQPDSSNLGTMIAKTVNVENFEGRAISSLDVKDAFSMRARATVGERPEDISAIRDFDGNDLGAGGSWKYIGTADAQYDNDAEYIYVNSEIGRWASVGPDANGNIDFGNHGAGGDTRVVGIYIDPEVEAGRTVRGSEFDSQQRFENDLKIDNLSIIDAFDFDADGFQEMYFKVNDGSAYLRALMHEDGNIQYANYQSREQVDTYLTDLGYGQEVVDTILM